jgi:phenylalanyl-tRNA synthetase beta chain
VTYALTSPERLARLQSVGTNPGVLPDELSQRVTDRFLPLDVPPLEIVNPLSRESDVLRTTVFGSMLETVGQNLRVADRDVLLFEFGNSYLRRTGDLPEQQATLAVGAGAWRSGPQWGRPLDNDFFWLKGVAEAVLEQLGLRSRVYRPLRHPLFHPGRAAAVLVPGPKDDGASETLLGVLGEVAPDVRAAFDLDQPAFLLGLSLDAALPLASRTRTVVPVPRFPSVVQDLAVVLPSSVAAWDVENLIREAGTPLLKTSELFDIYQGPPIPDGKISLAYHLTYQAPDRTLTDREVAEVQSRIEAALVGQLGAELRR